MKQLAGLSRRAFLRDAGLSAMALTLGCHWRADGEGVANILRLDDADEPTELSGWISIDRIGKVTIFTNRSEMGQGTWQTIPQIVAEELEVNMDAVNIKFAAANPGKFGPQPQEGSFSIRGWYHQLLRVGATAREMLIEAAAKQWHVDPSACYAENGHVVQRTTGVKLAYGVLVKDAAQLQPPQDVKLKLRKDYKVIGTSLRRKDTLLKVNGSAVFGMDMKLPGMLYAVVERSPTFREG